ncbi:hypothetical protein [Levilactobacillus sp. 244-2]|uniref:hypothetical protein n=1 Tax=Levilactobacillus sp. 244-2 TaxID=2799569 RepID=UPI00195075A1|nr:hypothetical protein [Levilactobacillus sp. 244-2]
MIATTPQTSLVETEKQRINDLLASDEQSNAEFDSYYRQAMLTISDNLQKFYLNYADDTGLTLAQARRSVSHWDVAQWRRVLRQFDMTDWDDNAKFLAGKYSYDAGFNRISMIDAIIGISLVDLTAKVQKHVEGRLSADFTSQQSHLKQVMDNYLDRSLFNPVYRKPIKIPAGKSIITQGETTSLWSDRLWLNSEEMANDVQNLVNKHIRHGMSIDDLKGLLRGHANKAQFKPGQSVADRVKQMDYNASRLLRSESARIIDEANTTTYEMAGVKMVEWVTEPGACDTCQNIADNGPYVLADAPSIPGDTHLNCRCSKIPFLT